MSGRQSRAARGSMTGASLVGLGRKDDADWRQMELQCRSMDGRSGEWWRRVFDSSYPRIYAFMERHTDRDLAFLKDVLELKPGMSLLDMCCGYGRHSIPL